MTDPSQRESGIFAGRSAVDAIAELSKRFPRPTNAMALAALDAPWEGRTKDAGVLGGFTPEQAEAWFPELGVLTRMRMVACGWQRRGDKLRAPTDLAWWSRPFELPLWVPLATYAATAQDAGHRDWVFSEALSNGDSDELAKELAQVTKEIAVIRDRVADGCLPYKVPAKPGQQPQRVDACVAAIRAAQKFKDDGGRIPGDPTNPPASLKLATLIAFGVLAYVAYRAARKHL